MSPGFIGVGAGQWTIPTPPAEGAPEAYFFTNTGNQLFVCRDDLSIAPVGGPLTDHFIFDLVSYDDPNSLAIWTAGPVSPPNLFYQSTDGGATLSPTSYPEGQASDNAFITWSAPEFTLSYTDWWGSSNGPATPDGGVYRDHTGVAGTIYTHLLTKASVVQLLAAADRIYALRHGAVDTTWIVAQSSGGGALTDVATIATGSTYMLIRGLVGTAILTFSSPNYTEPGTIKMIDGTTVTTPTGFASGQTDLSYPATVGSVSMVTTVDGTNVNVWKSTDGGASWTLVKTWAVGGGTGFAPPIVPCWTTPGVWWVSGGVSEGGLGWWRTHDDGVGWTFILGSHGGRFKTVGAGKPSSSGGGGFGP